MNISSNVNNGLVHTSTWDNGTMAQTQAKGREAETAELADITDHVNVSTSGHTPTLLEDHEVEAILQDTLETIGNDPYAALHVHSGLDASRVAALLA